MDCLLKCQQSSFQHDLLLFQNYVHCADKTFLTKLQKVGESYWNGIHADHFGYYHYAIIVSFFFGVFDDIRRVLLSSLERCEEDNFFKFEILFKCAVVPSFSIAKYLMRRVHFPLDAKDIPSDFEDKNIFISDYNDKIFMHSLMMGCVFANESVRNLAQCTNETLLLDDLQLLLNTHTDRNGFITLSKLPLLDVDETEAGQVLNPSIHKLKCDLDRVFKFDVTKLPPILAFHKIGVIRFIKTMDRRRLTAEYYAVKDPFAIYAFWNGEQFVEPGSEHDDSIFDVQSIIKIDVVALTTATSTLLAVHDPSFLQMVAQVVEIGNNMVVHTPFE